MVISVIHFYSSCYLGSPMFREIRLTWEIKARWIALKPRTFVLITLVALGVLTLFPKTFLETAQAQVTSVEFDVIISLYNNPTTDAERAPYEAIIGYFADAVFEATNGAHKIGTVTIFPNGANSDRADIGWTEKCGPKAPVSGLAVAGQFIKMCDIFGATNFLTNDLGHQGGGYTLGHEWGHYGHSIYDEYTGSVSFDAIFHFPHSTDDPVPDSIMNSQWNARGGNFEWLNHSTPNNDTGNTAQSRVYGASGWETLARPLADDPRDGPREALPERIFYAELAGVAPGEGEDPAIDLPDPAARESLEIIWATGGVAFQIVIDRSGSMGSENKIDNAKTAAKLLVDLAEIDSSTIGVISFSSGVTVVQPLTAIDSKDTKDAIKAQIDTISAGGFTAIGDALQKALDDFVAFGGKDTSRIVFLLTNGQTNTGSNPLDVIPGYQDANISIFTFAYGSSTNEGLLQQLANDTGGEFHFSPTKLSELAPIFESASQSASPRVGISSGSTTVPSFGSVSFPIQVDSTLAQLSIVVIYPGPISGIDLTLMNPSGGDAGTPDCTLSGAETLCLFSVDNPDPGTWHLTATAVDVDIKANVTASGLPAGIITYGASLTSLTGNIIQYPEPIVILAVLAKEVPISGATVIATVEKPDGTVESFSMTDDGVAPDADADDGLYSAILDYDENGVYNITVQFNNDAGTAQFTQISLQPSNGEDGQPIALAIPIPVAENFQRSVKAQLIVENVQSDDHGDTPADATALPDDNTDIPGKIDFEGDLDVFVVNASVTTELVLRISNLALGMDPRLRVLASDTVTVLADGDLTTNASKNGYLYLPISVNAGDTIYAEISHRSAGTGTYEISAGVSIASDVPLPVSVGGTTSFLIRGSGSSPGSFALLAGGVAAVLAIAAASGWYARGRCPSSRL